jgi:hypothetical protein
VDAVIAVVTDLFFAGRIQSAASAAHVPLQFIVDLDRLPDRIGGLVLIDLEANVDVDEAIRAAKDRGSPAVVAFGPHVDTERRKVARAAGADRVLAKSRFVTELPSLVRAQHEALVRDQTS